MYHNEGYMWQDAPGPIRANPGRDSIELWAFKVRTPQGCGRTTFASSHTCYAHLYMQTGGGWHHNVHTHLVDAILMCAKGRIGHDSYEDWDILRQSRGQFRSLNPLYCDSDAECPEAFLCSENKCTITSPCEFDSQCPFGESINEII